MKKIFVVFAVLVYALSFAQPGEGKREKGNPEQNIEKRLKEMTSDLNLSEKQQNQIRAILMEQAKKREAKRAEMKTKREKGVKPSDKEKAEMKKNMIDDQLEMKTRMKAILSVEQLKKLQGIHNEKRKGMDRERHPTEK